MAMVELEEIPTEMTNDLSSLKEKMTTHDAERLFKLIENHARYTNSAKAQSILADWDSWLPKFKKVMPTEFRRALNEMEAAQQAEDSHVAGE